VVRFAFTLIELIFAIVVIGISVITIPTMNQVTTDGLEGNLVQEAIFAASTELNQAVTTSWDDNSFEANATDASSRVIDIGGICSSDTTSIRFRYKPGHIIQPYHRRCLDSNTTTPSDNTDASADVESLNDIAGTKSLSGTDSDARVGYKSSFTTTISVTRPAGFNGTNNNIKEITATVKDSDGDDIVVLRTFSANIGEIDYYKRNY